MTTRTNTVVLDVVLYVREPGAATLLGMAQHGISTSSVLFGLASLQIFLIGLLAEGLILRLHRGKPFPVHSDDD